MESRLSPKRRTSATAGGLRVHWECWFWATAFLSVMVILAVLRFDAANKPVDEFNVFNDARLDEFAAHPAPYKVIMLGDSRLKYATLPDDDLATLAAKSNASVAFLRIVQNQAQFSDFEPFLGKILRAKPDIVILQRPLLTRHRHNNIELRKLQKFIVWALIDGEGTWNPDGLDQRALQFETPCTSAEPMSDTMSDQNFEAAVVEVRKRGTPDPEGPNAEAVHAFIESAHRVGTKVVILSVPATPSYWRVVAEAFPDNGAYFVPSGIVEWKYPGNYPAREYCDLLHLLPDARATHSEWLANRTVRELRRGKEKLGVAQSRPQPGTE